MKRTPLLLLAGLAVASVANAGAFDERLADYRRQGAQNFDARAGEAFVDPGVRGRAPARSARAPLATARISPSPAGTPRPASASSR